MAIKKDHQLLSGIVLQDVYWTFGVIELRIFDETARLELWPFLSKSLRRQQLTEDQQQLQPDQRLALLTPIRIPELQPKVLHVPAIYFQQYFAAAVHSGENQNIVEAAWRFCQEIDEPFGLASFFTDGERV